MPPREDQTEQENATIEESKEAMNDSKKEKTQQKVLKRFRHLTDISSEESEDPTNKSKTKEKKPRQQSVLSRRSNSTESSSEESEKEEQRERRNIKKKYHQTK